MSSNFGSVDFKDLVKLQKKIEAISKPEQLDELMESACNEIAARLLAKTVKRTPVGQYPSSVGKVGGTLRRGWKVGKARKVGKDYVIDVTNIVEYTSYVEYGHRTPDHKGWVQGQFMLTISEEEIRTLTPKLLEKKLNKYLKEVLK